MKRIVFLLFMAATVFAQEFQPEDFFPFHVGDVWEYSTDFQDDAERRTILRDSVAVEGHYLFYRGHGYVPDETLPSYLVDTSLYVTRNPFSPRSWVRLRLYKLDADSGDTWVTWTSDDSTEQGRALVSDVYDSYVLGRPSRVKVIDYYDQAYGDTLPMQDGSVYSHTDHIAAGFGFIFRLLDGAQWPEYTITGAIIDNVTSGTIVSLDKNGEALPASFELKPNYPNPFNPVTTIEFSLDKKAAIELGVFNIRGQKVAILALGEYGPGSYSYRIDASYLASGEYIYYLKTKERTLRGRMTLIK